MTRPVPDHLRGDVATLYDGSGVGRAWDLAKDFLAAHPPDAVQLHTFPGVDAGPLSGIIRRALPGAALWLGIGCDFPMSQLKKGAWPEDRVVDTLARMARHAKAIGAVAFVLDPEDAYKAKSAEEHARFNHVARRIVTACDAELAGTSIVLAHTAYDHPTYHTEYAWEGFVGDGSPVTLDLPQVYAAPGAKDAIPRRGALETRSARSLDSFRVARTRHMIREDIETPAGDPSDDLDVRPYVQLHHVKAEDTISFALRTDQVCYWAMRSRMDADGEEAWKSIRKLRRLGKRGPDAVAEFQRDMGSLKVDNVAGPLTRAVLAAIR